MPKKKKEIDISKHSQKKDDFPQQIKSKNGLNKQMKKEKNIKFSVGDFAVYPAHGVGTIEAIETQEINGEELNLYVIKIVDNDMTIMVPTTNVQTVGLRNIMPKEEIPKLYKTLQKVKDINIDKQTWNRRHKEYADKIKTGSLYDVAEVFRNLSLLKIEKELSFGERKLFDTAQNLLVKEISLSKKKSEKKIEAELLSFVSRTDDDKKKSVKKPSK